MAPGAAVSLGRHIRAIFLAIALLVVLAVGETVVLLGRNFDLSIGSTVGLSAMVAGFVLKGDARFPEVLVFAVAIAVGATVGITNGLLVSYLRVPSIVLTLGMLYLVSGVTYIVAHGNQVNPYNVPSGFVSLSITSPIVGIPWIVIVAFVFAVLMAAVLLMDAARPLVVCAREQPRGGRTARPPGTAPRDRDVRPERRGRRRRRRDVPESVRPGAS